MMMMVVVINLKPPQSVATTDKCKGGDGGSGASEHSHHHPNILVDIHRNHIYEGMNTTCRVRRPLESIVKGVEGRLNV